MDVITQITYDIQQLKTRLANMLQTGKVNAIYADEGLVDVAVDELVLEKIPFFTTRASADKTYWMPSIGEQGVVLSPSGNPANAMFLPALNSIDFPPPETDAKWTVREWEDGAKESYDKDAHEYELQIDANTHRKINQTGIEDQVGTNVEELTAIVLNLLGAHLFPSGITTFQSPVGPVMFAPGSTPTTAPAAPTGSAPDADGNVTQTPASTISGINIQTVSTLNFTVPAIAVTIPGGAGVTVATPVSVATTGTLTLQFPARAL